jgi:hypothetical protein
VAGSGDVVYEYCQNPQPVTHESRASAGHPAASTYSSAYASCSHSIEPTIVSVALMEVGGHQR